MSEHGPSPRVDALIDVGTAIEDAQVDELRAKLPDRIGLCPVHQEEFFYPLAKSESLQCPCCTLQMTEYVRAP